MIHGDFDRKRRAAPAVAGEVEHAAPLLGVVERRRHQRLDGPADQLARGPAEHRFERTVGGQDDAVRIDRDDALRGGLEQRPQRAIALLVATRLPRFLRPPVRVEVEIESDEADQIALGVTIRASAALDPGHGAVWPHNAERTLPRVPGVRLQHLVEESKELGTVVLVHAQDPFVCVRRFVGRKPVELAEPCVPVDGVRRGIPRPRSAGRRFERQAVARFPGQELRLDARALDGVPGPSGDGLHEIDLRPRPVTRRNVVGAIFPPLNSVAPMNAAICRDRSVCFSASGMRGSVSTFVTATVSPRRNASRRIGPVEIIGDWPTSGITPCVYSRRMMYCRPSNSA